MALRDKLFSFFEYTYEDHMLIGSDLTKPTDPSKHVVSNPVSNNLGASLDWGKTILF